MNREQCKHGLLKVTCAICNNVVNAITDVVKAKPQYKLTVNVTSHKWIETDPNYKPPVITGITCIGCKKPTQVMCSVYGRLAVSGFNTSIITAKVIDHKIVETRHDKTLPKVITGNLCNDCYDNLRLYPAIFTPTNPPEKVEVREHRPSRRERLDDDKPRGLDGRKRATEIVLNKNGEAEEWKISVPQSPKDTEPVDPKAYRHFMGRGRR